MNILRNPWFLAVFGLILAVGSAFVSYKMLEPPEPPTDRELELDLVDGAGAAALWNIRSGELSQLAQALADEKERLKEKAASIEELRERYASEKLELIDMQEEIARMQEELKNNIMIIEASEVKNLKKQADIYSEMDPENVVKIFAEMDKSEVAEYLYFMEEDTIGALFAAMVEQNIEMDDLEGAEVVANFNRMLRYNKPAEGAEQGAGF